jgi:glycosyltransferase involved in cell wall biosynthesis
MAANTRLGIKYLGPVGDSSGYAEFSRNMIAGLHQFGNVNLTVEGVSFENQRTDFGKAGKIVQSLMDKTDVDYKIKVCNVTPNFMEKLKEPGVKNVSFTMFETSRIPSDWIVALNTHADACFVPCQWNKEVFEDSGVKIPIHVCPVGMNPTSYANIDSVPEAAIANVKPTDFVFYSIFQWTERKHPMGLLKAYWSAFTGRDDVVLVLKTYLANTSGNQREIIKKNIAKFKDSIRLPHYPKVVFIGDLLSKSEITQLHKRGNCFVLPHRAEGFGMPHFEAMAMGNPVITTGFSGNMEFMNRENSYLLDYQMTPVSGMKWIHHYTADMNWAEPNLCQLQEYMRHVAANRDEAAKVGELARKHVMSNFTWKETTKTLEKACRKVCK